MRHFEQPHISNHRATLSAMPLIRSSARPGFVCTSRLLLTPIAMHRKLRDLCRVCKPRMCAWMRPAEPSRVKTLFEGCCELRRDEGCCEERPELPCSPAGVCECL